MKSGCKYSLIGLIIPVQYPLILNKIKNSGLLDIIEESNEEGNIIIKGTKTPVGDLRKGFIEKINAENEEQLKYHNLLEKIYKETLDYK